MNLMAECPYCDKEIKVEEITKEKVKSGLLKIDKAIYSCPHCDKILGITTDS